jgi:hypothetical protein
MAELKITSFDVSIDLAPDVALDKARFLAGQIAQFLQDREDSHVFATRVVREPRHGLPESVILEIEGIEVPDPFKPDAFAGLLRRLQQYIDENLAGRLDD